MRDDGILPPMPPSDQESLDRNRYDGFYKVGARDFWKESEINRFQEPPSVKCEHEFVSAQNGIKCKKCNFGLLGSGLYAKDGMAYAQGEQIKF